MKHATESTLRSMGSLLAKLRKPPGLKERKLGVFYRKSAAFLHFHEDPLGIFGHLKMKDGWERISVNGKKEMAAFLKKIERAIGE